MMDAQCYQGVSGRAGLVEGPLVVYNPLLQLTQALSLIIPRKHKSSEVGLPFKALLNELVAQVEGATGAVFLASDGEAVQWCADSDGSRLRLRAAYVAVLLEACRALSNNIQTGEVSGMVVQYEHASFVIQTVGGGYFVVLELEPLARIGEALHLLKPVAERLRAELTLDH